MEWIGCDLRGADDAGLVFQATDTNYHLPGVFSIVRCRRCHPVYLNPRPDQHEIQRYYPENEYFCFKTEAEPPGLGQDDPLLRVIEGLDLAVTSLCDVGCGSGRFLLAAQRTGWQVAGIEPNFEIVAESQPTGANSLTANVLRGLRRLLLDPLSQAGDGSRGSPAGGPMKVAEKQAASYYAVSDGTKARALRLSTRVVYPVARLVARSGLGPELRLYACKA